MLHVFDDRKRELIFMHPPKRIVSLVPSDTLNVVALGGTVVGRTRYCEHALDAPVVGGTKDVDVKAVRELAPDLILANQEENSRQHLEELAQGGVPVLISFPCTVADGVAHLARLARILAVDARELLRKAYAATREQPGALRSAFVPIWMDPLMTVNGRTFTSDALRLAGCSNVFADRERRYPLAADVGQAVPSSAGTRDTRYPRVTLEEVAERKPELVLLPDEPHEFTEADAEVFRRQLTKSKSTVAFVNGRDLMWYGAASIEGIPRLRALVAGLAALLLFALPAHAYNEQVHALITQKALAHDPGMNEVLQPPDVDKFRAEFWKRVSYDAEFRARFPTPESFTAWDFKELLMLDPAARVHGFDAFHEPPMTRLEWLTQASRWPDDDERNRHRYLRDPKTHEIVKAADGTPMPYDPATLDFGSLTGTTSQGHAHYGLVQGPLSDDPDVLKKDPRRFAVPPTAHAYGCEMADLYTDLAAMTQDPALKATFLGAAFHHVEDVCNQIHTVQVGIYEFFESAYLQSKKRDVLTLGGLFGRRYSLKQIGLRLIANHHLLSEDWFAKHVGDVELSTDDPEVVKMPDLCRGIIEVSSQEAPQVYRLAWKFSAATLRDGVHGHEYVDGKDDPDAYVVQSPALEEFRNLELRGLQRAATAVRQLWRRPAPDAAAEKLMMIVMPYHRAAAQRRAAYKPAGPDEQGIAWGYPVAAVALLGGAAALIFVRSSKRS